jgi:hypothetical protein
MSTPLPHTATRRLLQTLAALRTAGVIALALPLCLLPSTGWAIKPTPPAPVMLFAVPPGTAADQVAVRERLGRKMAPGKDWLALVCTTSSCQLEPAELSVRASQWQGHYDDTPTPSQTLRWQRNTPAAPGRVLAWLRAVRPLPGLQAGPLVTYSSAAAPMKRPRSEGTLEEALPLPDGQQASLVPLLHTPEPRHLVLQLRTPAGRQVLGAMADHCNHHHLGRTLLWAGDLDGDARLDLLLYPVGGQAVLYLSSLAAPAGLVAQAGSDGGPPFGGECDGEASLE